VTAFIFHHAYHSGGRWHIAKDIEVKLVKEASLLNDDKVIDYNTKVSFEDRETGILEGKEYAGPYGQRGGYTDRYYHREVPAIPGYYHPVLGHVKSRSTTPEHVIVKAKAACGQLSNKTLVVSNLYDTSGQSWRQRTAKKNIGEFLELKTARIGRLLFEKDGITPEPLCQYCANMLMLTTEQQVKYAT